jgi:hypothetical protein
VKALIVANEFLETEVKQLQAAVSNGYARGKFEPVPPRPSGTYGIVPQGILSDRVKMIEAVEFSGLS